MRSKNETFHFHWDCQTVKTKDLYSDKTTPDVNEENEIDDEYDDFEYYEDEEEDGEEDDEVIKQLYFHILSKNIFYQLLYISSQYIADGLTLGGRGI